jgi:myosin heavy subunit
VSLCLLIVTLQGEQEEYVREGIKWSYVDFIDNQETLDLLEGGAGGAASLGVFPLIDEANRIARATYQVRAPARWVRGGRHTST